MYRCIVIKERSTVSIYVYNNRLLSDSWIDSANMKWSTYLFIETMSGTEDNLDENFTKHRMNAYIYTTKKIAAI